MLHNWGCILCVIQKTLLALAYSTKVHRWPMLTWYTNNTSANFSIVDTMMTTVESVDTGGIPERHSARCVCRSNDTSANVVYCFCRSMDEGVQLLTSASPAEWVSIHDISTNNVWRKSNVLSSKGIPILAFRQMENTKKIPNIRSEDNFEIMLQWEEIGYWMSTIYRISNKS